ncbi:MAG: hypothetical protein D6681_08970 [Calditrichaeota bacterium]|nr:MAG: hypothetical protein D6681_08970 [Calditrichota bacterium]
MTSNKYSEAEEERRREEREAEKRTLDQLLDKISQQGYDSLSEYEKKMLEEISRKLKNDPGRFSGSDRDA